MSDAEPSAEDEKLLAELRLAAQLDPVPLDLEAAVKARFALTTLDAELAELTYDSSQDDRALAGVRSAEPARLLTFESPALTVEVEASADGAHRRLVGQLLPAQPARLILRHGEDAVTVEADELGRFSVEGIEPGPISLHCEGTKSTVAVTTDWVIV